MEYKSRFKESKGARLKLEMFKNAFESKGYDFNTIQAVLLNILRDFDRKDILVSVGDGKKIMAWIENQLNKKGITDKNAQYLLKGFISKETIGDMTILDDVANKTGMR